MGVKRFMVKLEVGQPEQAIVLAADYDALLAVLRRCVEAGSLLATVERSEWTGIKFHQKMHNAIDKWDAALAKLGGKP